MSKIFEHDPGALTGWSVALIALLTALLVMQLALRKDRVDPPLAEFGQLVEGSPFPVSLLGLSGDVIQYQERECWRLVVIDPGCRACEQLLEKLPPLAEAPWRKEIVWVSSGSARISGVLADRHGIPRRRMMTINPKIHASHGERLVLAGVPITPLTVILDSTGTVVSRRFLRSLPTQASEHSCVSSELQSSSP